MKRIAFLSGLAVSLIGLFVCYFLITKDLDAPESHLPTGLIMFYKDGSPVMLSRAFWKNLPEVPTVLINALISSEDKNFVSHIGIDLEGIVRATVRNLSTLSINEGASTITQQLARTLYLSLERTWERKIREIFIALWLERVRTKDEILQMYLNSAYMGNGLYGLASASNYYFGKDLSTVNLQESAILVGMIRSPENYNPFKDPELSKKKAKTVLAAMLKEGYLTQEQYDEQVQMIDNIAYTEKKSRNTDEEVFWRVVRELNSIGFGLNEVRQGYRIYTTLDPLMMKNSLQLDQNTVAEAIDPFTGAVLAYRGVGLTYPEGRRQLGSAIKPLYYYLALLEGWGLESRLTDLPVKIGDWTPENFDKQYKGSVSLAQALIESRNIPSVNLFMQLGKDKVVQFLQKEMKLNGYYPNDLTISLGTVESAPEEILKCYAAIFNGGVVLQPYIIDAIQDPYGRIIYKASPKVVGVIKGRKNSTMVASSLLLSVMKRVVEQGTGVYARQKVAVAGKTGTSEKTAWFIGGDSQIILAVAVDGENLTGGVNAAPVWSKMISSYSYRGVLPNWEIQVSKAEKSTYVMPTLDTERILQWIEEGKLTLDSLLKLTEQMSNSMILDLLSALNQSSPELARDLWERVKDTRSW
ncbi:MAG TPA: transglycosylase domain-containing protein [Pseudothermotoga sp.]|nr:transglycosylase domain-containing protein [Pseudothermotoga sp.]